MRKIIISLMIMLTSFSTLAALATNRCVQNLDVHYYGKRLYLTGCDLHDNDMKQVVMFIDQKPKLVEIDLSHNHLTDDGIITLMKMKEKPNLSGLNFSQNEISDKGAAAIGTFFAKNPKPLNLYLNNNKIGDAGAISLSQIKLWYLQLNHNNIGDKGASALAHKKDQFPYLDLADNPIGLPGLKELAQAETIDGLDLSQNHLADKEVSLFAETRNISTLILNDNDIHAAGAASLATNKKLHYLSLNNNQIEDAGAAVLGNKKGLQTLFIANNHITNTGVIALALQNKQFDPLDRIHRLDLSQNSINYEGISTLAKNFGGILTLRANHLDNKSASILGEYQCSLDLAENDIGDEGAIALGKKSPHCAGGSIDLSSNPITTKGVIALVKNEKQAAISLDNNNLTDEAAIVIGKHATLQALSLNNNHITTKGIAALAKNPALQWLSLTNNDLNDEAIQLLTQNPNIYLLILDNNNITNQGALSLASAPQMRYIIVRNNHIGPTGLKALINKPNLFELDIDGNDGEFLKFNKYPLPNERDQYFNKKNNICSKETLKSQQ